MIFELKIKRQFVDRIDGSTVQPGEILGTCDEARAKDIIERKLGVLYRITPDESTEPKDGTWTAFFHDYLAKIGGIETALYEVAKAYPDRKLSFTFQRADFDQAKRIGKYHPVNIDNGELEYTPDVAIVAAYNAYKPYKGRIKAKKIYQMCHADWKELRKFPTFRNYEWNIDEDIDKVIAVSETAAKSLKSAFRKPIDSTVVHNLPPTPEEKPVVFFTLSRLSPEKGSKRILRLIEKFHEEGKSFLWVIAANQVDPDIDAKLRKDPSVIMLSPSPERTSLIPLVDYVVQLSDCESSCYTLHEAMAYGKAFLGTKIPEFEKHIKDGKNGYLLDLDLRNLDVEKIFNEIPTPKPVKEEPDAKWEQLLEGEL